MKPVDQRVVNFEGYGDCMTACLASLLDLPYEDVPQLRKIQTEGGSWFRAMTAFLDAHGYEYLGSFYPLRVMGLDGVVSDRNWEELPTRCEGVGGFYMAGGPSPRGPQVQGGHAVIIHADGTLAHDPHPSRAGVVKIDNVYMIQPTPALQDRSKTL